MPKQTRSEKPEVYALRQDGSSWQISRRDFLKAAAAGTAAISAGLHSRLIRPANAEDLRSLCHYAPAHKHGITDMLSSPDGNYLITLDLRSWRLKCWNFHTTSLVASRDDAPISELDRIMKTGSIEGKQYLFFTSDKDHIAYRELPLLDGASGKSFGFSLSENGKLTDFTIGKNGDIYAVLTVTEDESQISSDIVCFERGTWPARYQTRRDIYTQIDGGIREIAFVHDDRELFIRFESGDTALLDPETGEIRAAGINDLSEYTILPDGDTVFAASKSEYYTFSLSSGRRLWSRNIDDLKTGPLAEGGDLAVSMLKVTGDGSTGILLGYPEDGNYQIWLVSMAEGNCTGHLDLQLMQGNKLDGVILRDMEIGADGSRLALGVSPALMFISLPDLEVIGCPVDVDEMTNDNEGIELSAVDPLTGETVSYTLPAGADFPAGGVCICNTVTGRGGDPCTCDAYVYYCTMDCSCDIHTRVNPHYWHPN